MVRSVAAFGFFALCLAFTALELFSLLSSQPGAGTTTSAEASLLLDSAAEVFPTLAAVVFLFLAVALTCRHLMSHHVVDVAVAGAAGNNVRRSISGLLMFVLCVCTGTLQFIVFGFGQAAAADHGALALAALRALPAAATAMFFLGMMLIIIAHVRAGGEGGGGVAARDGPIQALLRLLTKVAAATLVGLIAMALTLYDAKY